MVCEVREMGECNACGQILHEYNRNVGSNRYPKYEWVGEEHAIKDCIRYLREQIESLKDLRKDI